MKTIIKLLTIFSLTFLFVSSAYAFPKSALRPGGVAVIVTTPATHKKPTVYYQSRPVALIKGRTNWLAIVGISLKAKAGMHQIRIKQASGKEQIKKFQIKRYNYKIQRLTIPNKNKVNPNKKSQKRIEREFFIKQRLKKTYSDTTPRLNFIKPVSGRDSGRFGLKRILNKQKRNPHSGMDIAAPKGRSVKATESGQVLYIGNLFFTGKVVYLDHGNGVISLYAHLSKINVKKGQYVKRGQIIAKVGRTGRVTGAHLHWSVYLNGNAVDPALFLTKRKKR